MRDKKLTIALLGMLPHNQESHGFQLYFLFYESTRSLLIVCFSPSKPRLFSRNFSDPPSQLVLTPFSLFILPDTQLIPLFLLPIQAPTSSIAYLLLHCSPFRKRLHLNHHHDKVVVSLAIHATCSPMEVVPYS